MMEEARLAELSDELLAQKVINKRIELVSNKKKAKKDSFAFLVSSVLLLIAAVILYSINFPIAFDEEGNVLAYFHQYAVYPFYFLLSVGAFFLVFGIIRVKAYFDSKKELEAFEKEFPSK